uniref:DUF1731 domain-containing protein n=1 Tax=Ciona savignyi TaxID=51511 RepID=H2YQM5_CIOSA
MSSKVAVIGGGTGFIGQALCKSLERNGYKTVAVSRNPGKSTITWKYIEQEGLPKNTEIVINLAGEPVLNVFKRWSASFKKEVWESRISTTNTLKNAVLCSESPPKLWGSISGVGFYPPSSTLVYNEDSKPGSNDLWSDLTHAWENAGKIEHKNIRHVVVRSGVVLAKSGGALPQMLIPFKLGLGGPIGDGSQWFPWIHIDDIVGIFMHAIQNNSVNGVLNGVAPDAKTNQEFSKYLGSVLRRPAILPMPSFAVNMLYGPERGIMLLQGQNVYPKLTQASGYKFVYPTLENALREASS